MSTEKKCLHTCSLTPFRSKKNLFLTFCFFCMTSPFHQKPFLYFWLIHFYIQSLLSFIAHHGPIKLKDLISTFLRKLCITLIFTLRAIKVFYFFVGYNFPNIAVYCLPLNLRRFLTQGFQFSGVD